MTSTTRWRRPAAVLLLTGAVLFLVGLAITPWESEDTSRAYHDALAAHPGQAQTAALVLAFAYAVLTAGAFAGLGVLGERRSWWLRLAAVCIAGGLVMLPGLLVTDAYDLALAQELPRATSVRVTDAVEELWLAAALGLLALVGMLLGTTLLCVALWRAGEVPGAVPALVAAGWVVGMIDLELALVLGGAALLVVAFALAARSLWREAPPAAPATATAPA